MESITLSTPSGIPVEITAESVKAGLSLRLAVELPTKSMRGYATISTVPMLRVIPHASEATHYLPIESGPDSGKMIGLTPAEAARLDGWILEQLAADPAGRIQLLRADRKRLAREIKDVLDEIADAREDAFQGDTGEIPSYDSPEYRAAFSALVAFDAAHPEIIAQIERESAASAARNRWM